MITIGLTARAKLPPEIRRNIHFCIGDMRSFSFEIQFPLIIIPFHSFWSNMNRAEAEQCVRCILDVLTPAGVFLVDTPTLNDEFLLGSKYDWWVETAEKFKFSFRMERYTKPDGARLGEILVSQKNSP
ncbi:MAG: hypothetical protein A2939_02705 [Parcubacteria group bacterium RIFCSPLOWO2_01_FULL_48_18]|nr:MAG: hypothetical protein A2939_02705 [Parcubacteria group bacterium RIFCSPLOWO2_01_FULL_48_18]OHB22998.1 MAG: hypothetical protein A3J67_03840 [Parcubacteria group bacterium RIFCSPHIGHO2_02_FULL_48_10b]